MRIVSTLFGRFRIISGIFVFFFYACRLNGSLPCGTAGRGVSATTVGFISVYCKFKYTGQLAVAQNPETILRTKLKLITELSPARPSEYSSSLFPRCPGGARFSPRTSLTCSGSSRSTRRHRTEPRFVAALKKKKKKKLRHDFNNTSFQ